MFDHYLAFGDSLSIDEYVGPQCGAASLLFRNQDSLWPEFAGLDLVSYYPRCRFALQACNGATLAGLWRQLTEAPAVVGRVLATVTVGANDVFLGLGKASQQSAGYACGHFFGAEPVQGLMHWQQSLQRWLDCLQDQIPQVSVVLGNLYDPSDGSGVLPSGAPFGAGFTNLEAVNDILRRVSTQRGLALADIHGHFCGRAVDLIQRDYEPTRAGSSEIRRVFWEAAQRLV
ncbi:MAG: SGNH/GDSL hydrolase family protein [Vulcanimicrobiota bacterium]